MCVYCCMHTGKVECTIYPAFYISLGHGLLDCTIMYKMIPVRSWVETMAYCATSTLFYVRCTMYDTQCSQDFGPIRLLSHCRSIQSVNGNTPSDLRFCPTMKNSCQVAKTN